MTLDQAECIRVWLFFFTDGNVALVEFLICRQCSQFCGIVVKCLEVVLDV